MLQRFIILLPLIVTSISAQTGAQSGPSVELGAGYMLLHSRHDASFWTHSLPVSASLIYPIDSAFEIAIGARYARPMRNDQMTGPLIPAIGGYVVESSASYGKAEIGVLELQARFLLNESRSAYLLVGVGWERARYGPIQASMSFYYQSIDSVLTSTIDPYSTHVNWAPVYSLAFGISVLSTESTRLLLRCGVEYPTSKLGARLPIMLVWQFFPT